MPSSIPKALIATLRTAAAGAILFGAPFSFGVLIGISEPRVWIAHVALGVGTAVMLLTNSRTGALIALKRTLGYLLLAAGLFVFAIAAAWAKVLHSWVLLGAGALGLFLWIWALTRWVDLRLDRWEAAEQPDR